MGDVVVPYSPPSPGSPAYVDPAMQEYIKLHAPPPLTPEASAAMSQMLMAPYAPPPVPINPGGQLASAPPPPAPKPYDAPPPQPPIGPGPTLVTFKKTSGVPLVPIQLTYQGKPLDQNSLPDGAQVQYNWQTGEVIAIR